MKKIGLATQPVAYEKAAKTVVYLLVGFTIVKWTDAQIVLVLAVIESVLGLVVWNSVTPNSRVEAKVDAAASAARDSALADVASLQAPKKSAPKPRPRPKPPASRR